MSNNIYFINEDKRFVEICEKALEQEQVFIDTEFRLQTTYFPEPSLLQIMVNQDIYIVDLLSLSDKALSCLAKILSNENIIKVLHSGIQDTEILYKITHVKEIRSVFDTQVAACFLGLGDSLGYGKIVQIILDEQIDKKMQFSNWVKRPLSTDQIDYAAQDVVYLEPLYKNLYEELIARNLLEWFKEDMEFMYKEEKLKSSPLRIMERMKINFNSKEKFFLLAKMVLWREDLAIKTDTSRNKIIRDSNLVEFCSKYNGNNLEELLIGLDELSYRQIETVIKNESAQASELANMIYRLKNIHNYDKKKLFVTNEIKATEKLYGLEKNILVNSRNLKFLIASFQEKSLLNYTNLISGWRYEILTKKLFHI